ncbi:MAG: DUF1624 domain-containing protein [Methanomicrobiales archaeon]|nr:DUF1624 domain-containing protein [Methanomicrobiales archaeon]
MNLNPARWFPISRGYRFPEIDLARGLAIAMMVVYHTLFALVFAGVAEIPVLTGFWKVFQLTIAALFLGIAGVSLSVSASRAAKYLDRKALTRKFLWRGAGLIAAGMAITAVTLLIVPDAPVIFGVLSCLGVSLILSPLFFRIRNLLPLAGWVVILVGVIAFPLRGPALLLPLGVYPQGFSSLDWVPLFPWMGVVMLGIAAGDTLYPGGERTFRAPAWLQGMPRAALWPGRHSLLLYFVHVPVILILLSLFVPGFLEGFFAAIAV